jgi:ferredoxin
VYIGATGGFFYALAVASGAEKWRVLTAKGLTTVDERFDGGVVSSPVVVDGVVYFGSLDGKLYAVSTAAYKGPFLHYCATDSSPRIAGLGMTNCGCHSDGPNGPEESLTRGPTSNRIKSLHPDILPPMDDPTPYQRLAARLDSLPNGFPPAEDGSHLRLLACLFTSEEAALAADLPLHPETPAAIAARLGTDSGPLRGCLKEMARKGLIAAGRADGGLGYSLMPFVVGFYEMQNGRIDAELARRFEEYFHAAFHKALALQPPVHRVVPVRESVKADLAVAPYESALGILSRASAWGVTDCICRKQTALVGRPCPHPVEVCMVMSTVPGAYHGRDGVRELNREEAMDVLRRAAEAGLVHSVANTKEGQGYICNCCICSCAVLRGMAEGGMASVISRSGFVCRVDETSCDGCGLCETRCAFKAITVEGMARVEAIRCAGCGVCAVACPNHALTLSRRPEAEITAPLRDEREWLDARAVWRAQNPPP